jgi:hypothetical protein
MFGINFLLGANAAIYFRRKLEPKRVNALGHHLFIIYFTFYYTKMQNFGIFFFLKLASFAQRRLDQG